MNSKVCRQCNIEKTIDEYPKDGKKKNGDIHYRSVCKACIKQYKKQYYKQYYQDKAKQRYQDNKEGLREYQKQYRQDNKEHIKQHKKQYREQNKENIRVQRKHKRATDLEYKLKDNIRRRINNAIRSQLTKKSDHSHELLGIPMDKYIRWIEFQLKDDWTWDNWGSEFHIDHVYPISKYDLSKEEEQFKAFNWKNTRPLCKTENMTKSDKIIPNEVFQHKVVVLAFLFHEINFKH